MIIEIPDPEVIVSVIVAFLVGIFGFYLYYKLKPYVNLKPKSDDSSYLERLEYYETQLIDLKIRLDALDLGVSDEKSKVSKVGLDEIVQKLNQIQNEPKIEKEIKVPKQEKEERMPNLGYGDAINHVLRLITDKSMTSRDIQITINRTREHTSRLMKKLFEDGFVERNTNTKPYTYSITDRGREKLGILNPTPTTF